MYEKVLVPLDGSELSELALTCAQELAVGAGSDIILLHVREPGINPDDSSHREYMQRMLEATKRGAQAFFGEKKNKAIKITSVVIGTDRGGSNPAEEIIDYAEKEGAGLIIMATHGRSGIKRWALGSVAEKVVKAAQSPVMLIRAKTACQVVNGKGILKKFLVPLDISKESEAVIPYVKELVTKLDSEVVLLYVILEPYNIMAGSEGLVNVRYTEEEKKLQKENAEAYLKKMSDGLAAEGIRVRSEVRVGITADIIIDMADEIQADVVAMSTHGRSGISRWEHGSVTDKVLHGGNKPLLLVRPDGKV